MIVLFGEGVEGSGIFLPSGALVSLVTHDALRDNTGGWLESWLNGREMGCAGRPVLFRANGKRQRVFFPIRSDLIPFIFSVCSRAGFSWCFLSFFCISSISSLIASNYLCFPPSFFSGLSTVSFMDLPFSSRFSSFASFRSSFLALLSLSLSLLALIFIVSTVSSCTCTSLIGFLSNDPLRPRPPSLSR